MPQKLNYGPTKVFIKRVGEDGPYKEAGVLISNPPVTETIEVKASRKFIPFSGTFTMKAESKFYIAHKARWEMFKLFDDPYLKKKKRLKMMQSFGLAKRPKLTYKTIKKK